MKLLFKHIFGILCELYEVLDPPFQVPKLSNKFVCFCYSASNATQHQKIKRQFIRTKKAHINLRYSLENISFAPNGYICLKKKRC